MVIQNQFPTIILQKFNSKKYIVCISYYDYAILSSSLLDVQWTTISLVFYHHG